MALIYKELCGLGWNNLKNQHLAHSTLLKLWWAEAFLLGLPQKSLPRERLAVRNQFSTQIPCSVFVALEKHYVELVSSFCLPFQTLENILDEGGCIYDCIFSFIVFCIHTGWKPREQSVFRQTELSKLCRCEEVILNR